MANEISHRAALNSALDQSEIVVAPGIFDMLSVRAASEFDFKALYLTGYGVSASLLGKPDAGVATYTDFVGRISALRAITNLPLIADGDTGFGGLYNVQQTVLGYERAGASAIQIEDQEFPKRCGHTRGRRVVPTEDMVDKIKVAAQARRHLDFLIIARTDARTEHGLDEALSRADQFLGAGADILFVESPQSEKEIETIASRFKQAKLLINMVPGGHTPILPPTDLQAMGYDIVIQPTFALGVAAAALKTAYGQLAKGDTSLNTTTDYLDIEQLSQMIGFEDVWNLDDTFSK